VSDESEWLRTDRENDTYVDDLRRFQPIQVVGETTIILDTSVASLIKDKTGSIRWSRLRRSIWNAVLPSRLIFYARVRSNGTIANKHAST